MKSKNDIPDTIMSDEEIDNVAMGYSTISEQERARRADKASQAKAKDRPTRRLPNGEIDWDAVFGIKKRKPVKVSDEVMADGEIDALAE